MMPTVRTAVGGSAIRLRQTWSAVHYADGKLTGINGTDLMMKGETMTNREKFAEVFGFEQDGNPCVAPQEVCNHEDCDTCPFYGWWEKEYLPCFKMKGGKDD